MSQRRELFRSPNREAWLLAREPENGHAFIMHQPVVGGRLSHIELGAFLNMAGQPEQTGSRIRIVPTPDLNSPRVIHLFRQALAYATARHLLYPTGAHLQHEVASVHVGRDAADEMREKA